MSCNQAHKHLVSRLRLTYTIMQAPAVPAPHKRKSHQQVAGRHNLCSGKLCPKRVAARLTCSVMRVSGSLSNMLMKRSLRCGLMFTSPGSCSGCVAMACSHHNSMTRASPLECITL
jgi:hypothetical protein